MLRSEDPNGVAYQGVTSVVNGTGGDLSQYRILSAYLAVGLQWLLQMTAPPFQGIRCVQMALIARLAYVYYGQLDIRPFTRILGLALPCGLLSRRMDLL